MKKLYIIYKTLEEAYGPYRGWPADSPLEMMISSILVQNTNWNNVLTSLDNLKPHLHRLKTMDTVELEGLIRPSGFMKGKAQCIKDLLFLLDKGTPTRSDLLTIKGIGPETADCIMLYAFDQNYFVVDTYLKRLLSKAGFPNLKNYQSIQNFMHRNLPNSLDLYKAFHLYILESGKDKHRLLENLYFCYEDEDLNTLKEAHPIMKKLIDSRVEFKRPIYETPLHALIGAIIGQVISAKLSKEIYNNFMKDFPDPLEALNHDLEGFKLSRSKIDTIHRILDLVSKGQLDLGQLHEESDQVIYKTLTSIKGIGPWTAKVVLIHGYCRDDIAIKEDLVLRKSLEKHFGKEKDFDQVMNEFKPHRSLASIVLWEVN